LVDLILGLHTPYSGKLFAGTTELDADNIANWRATIGYVPQEIFLTDATILANVAFGVQADSVDFERARTACQHAQILSFIESELPMGWNTVVGERGVRLSGGQRQRLGLARALYLKPSILILDEATSALDMETERLVMEAVEQLRNNLTLIIVAHRVSTLEGCDMLYRIENSCVNAVYRSPVT
jgi:ATP-binding cassette subfamily C protein